MKNIFKTWRDNYRLSVKTWRDDYRLSELRKLKLQELEKECDKSQGYLDHLGKMRGYYIDEDEDDKKMFYDAQKDRDEKREQYYLFLKNEKI